MKLALVASLLVFAPSVFAAGAQEEGLSLSCSAEALYLDGQLDEFVRVECDSEFAGQCVKETREGNVGWVVVDSKECDQARAKK